jgi:O-methyltransferase
MMALLWPPPAVDEVRVLRRVRPYTMVGLPRLRTLYRLAQRVIDERVAGAMVECGTCNGGSGAILGHVAAQERRPVWLFDSFEGLPPPVAFDGEAAKQWTGLCVGQEDAVRQVLGQVGAMLEEVHIVKGWFSETLATSATGPIALLHLDGDWYESTRQILEALYDRVDPRGFLVVDDYGAWPGCRRAVDDFFRARGLAPQIRRSDYTGVWFRKP